MTGKSATTQVYRIVIKATPQAIWDAITKPEWTERYADKYNAMKRAILAVLPKASAGMTVADLKKGLLPLLPDDLFPGGAKAGWWLKGVQLDLEAKRLIARIDSKPMRLRRL